MSTTSFKAGQCTSAQFLPDSLENYSCRTNHLKPILYSLLQVLDVTDFRSINSRLLEVNADKTKYMVMSREQTAGLSHTVKGDNSSTERVEEFRYLGITLTNQNSIHEEIKSRLKLGNACYHSVQKLLSSTLLSKNLKIKIYRTIILPVVLYVSETWSLTLWVE